MLGVRKVRTTDIHTIADAAVDTFLRAYAPE